MKHDKFNHWGNYSRNIPLPTEGIEKRKAYIVGSGIAGLSAAYFLIRDAHMPAENITFLESREIEGGALDGAGNAEDGFIVRGGREMETCYENFWDIFQDIPAIELGEGYSILDEYRLANDKDPNYSKSRLMHKQGQIKDFSTFGLSKSQQKELTKLVLARKEDLDDVTVEEFFSKGFLETNFWYFWRTMFAFQNWQSVLEMKLYMHRFLHLVDGLTDMSSLVFPKYNQYENFVLPLSNFLKEKGVQYRYNTTVTDLEMKETDGKKQVTAIKYTTKENKEEVLKLEENDVVLVTNGSMTENSTEGTNTTVPEMNISEEGTCWKLWKNIAKHDEAFGKPEKFCGQPEKSLWESATMTLKPSALTKKVQELSVNDPYTGKTATGGIITFTDSNWILSFTCNRQPHFRNQPKDVLVIWVYALLMDTEGNYIKKKMPECTGDEILAELCYHLGIIDDFENIKKNTIVRTALMPYITSQFMPRAYGDRPKPFPKTSKNLGFMGQFTETENDVVFTVESSVRSAKEAVYGVIGIDKVVPDISPDQYDLRNLLRAMRTMNNGKPTFAEKVLKFFLGKTYFGDMFK